MNLNNIILSFTLGDFKKSAENVLKRAVTDEELTKMIEIFDVKKAKNHFSKDLPFLLTRNV